MEWIKDVLQWLNDNYSLLVIIIALAFGIFKKTKSLLSKSKEERIESIKNEIRQCILKMVSDAEDDYCDLIKAGEIKRSQVISEIFIQYPVLSDLVDQDEFIQWVDEQIGSALNTLRKVIEENEKSE